jgi:hypothetical protein
MNEILCILRLIPSFTGPCRILSMRTSKLSAEMEHTWSHDLPIGVLQPLKNVACTDLPFSLKIWVINSMCVNDLQCLQGPVDHVCKGGSPRRTSLGINVSTENCECLRAGTI